MCVLLSVRSRNFLIVQSMSRYHHSFSVPTTPEVSRIFWPILNKFYVNYGFSTSSEFFYFKSYHNTKNLRISHVVQRFSWLKTIWQFDDILDRSVIEKKKLSTIKVQLFKLFWQIAFCSALQFWLPKWRRNFKTILIFHWKIGSISYIGQGRSFQRSLSRLTIPIMRYFFYSSTKKFN